MLSRLLQDADDGLWDPLALAAKSNSADTYAWHEAMNFPEKKGFEEAAHVEIETLKAMGVWEVVDR